MRRTIACLAAILSCAPLTYGRAPFGPWDTFNYAPPSKTVFPRSIRSIVGDVSQAGHLVTHGKGGATFHGNGSYVVLDWLQEYGGRLSLHIDKATPQSALSLSFSESPQFISPLRSDDSCHSIPTMDGDGVQSLPQPLTAGRFTQTIGQQRGGFRYLTIVSNSDAPVTISDISLSITFMPHFDDLRDYSGYFSAEDPSFHDKDFLTKLWYAGAYTVQTNTFDVNEARQQPCPAQGWANNASAGPVEGPVLVDGAKRDRNIWPGDMGISTHTEFVSTNDMLPTKNSLLVMFSTQDPATGALQYSGPPINAHGSATYIAWSLIGTHSYFLYTGDLDLVKTVWANYTKALDFLQSHVDELGLMNVPVEFQNDWGRDGGAGHNSAMNALLYQTLVTGADLASHLGDEQLSASFLQNSTAIKAAFNRVLWDSEAGMFRDNETSTLFPQDGNSLAVLYNVTETEEQNQAISSGLTQFWTDIGPVSPELDDTIIPFVGGFEVQAHFVAGQGERGLDLLRKEWGYMLYTNLSVQSTLLEGFTKNGSLGYRSAAGYNFDHSYTSHAHGWATGPTPALTFFILGLTITSPKGATWSVAPVLGDLKAAEGGFETALGWFGVKWTLRNRVFVLQISTPRGTNGRVRLPGLGKVEFNGVMHDGLQEMRLDGGDHTFTQNLGN
ncbi:glycoside hydrolase family 78 protein [Pleurotus ostreatus PC15]|uniref:Glycoside hydrolase family 78 protein n=1 Tax=Pleurotus ostreatus (strain PC15) TaxID=1137138 RepID=A0A067NNC4_PLEO1|nr:glycoside hydrolase family 78 protein [Pleurotus ostreatus PC15]